MNTEKRHLIHDLLDEKRDARREATLRVGGRILRWRRWRRRGLQTLAVATLLGVAAISLQRMMVPRSPAVAAVPAITVPATIIEAQALTDAELLALFPDTPVGLATLENGRKRLIFPRPGDEERFITRL